MSSLSKITISKIENSIFHLKIESIHPDAPSLAWLNSQSEKTMKENALFRTLLVIEDVQSEDVTISGFFEDVYQRLIPKMEEEFGEVEPLSKFTEITELGSNFLTDVSDEVFGSIKIVEQDINDNWEKGLIVNFNPYKLDNVGIPYVLFEIELTNGAIEEKYIGKPTYSATGITCKYK